MTWYTYQKNERKKAPSKVESVGKAQLGGPFELVSMTGEPVTDKDYHGKFVLLYFGFTYCPDICPNELLKLGAALKAYEAENPDLPKIQPLFITVDPRRDTVAQCRAYCQDFHPRLQALTGTPEQIARITRAYRVYFNDVGVRDEDDDDYVVDHSIVMYFLGEDGEFIDFFPQLCEAPEIASRMAETVRERLEADGRLKKQWSLW